MIVFPNCKINLGLHILRKRNDGYHDLETVFFPLPLHDILEVTLASRQEKTSTIPFTMSGETIQGDSSTNLCLKAYWLLKKDFPDLPHIQMHLHKIIPAGAGLGGGSANASFALKVFNHLFQLGLTDQQLMDYGLQLGSDCPFFILNKPCLATGRGEKLIPIEIDLTDYRIILVNPRIHVNTGDAFRNLKPCEPEQSLMDVIRCPVEEWKDHLVNDFERVIFKKHREIVDIKDRLYVQGAVYAAMSGSGSSVFGIFDRTARPELSFPSHYFVRELIPG